MTGYLPLRSAAKGWKIHVCQLLYPGLMAALLMFPPGWADAADPTSSPASEDRSNLETAAANFHTAVEQGDWNQAAAQLRRAGEAAKPILLPMDASSMRLGKKMIRAARAVRERDRPAARRAANKLLEWIDASAHPEMPPDVAHLQYVGREIQIESSEDHPKKLAGLASEARQSWQRVKPALEKNGVPALIKEGDALLDALNAADGPPATMQLSSSLLEFTEKIKEAFKASPRP